MFLQDVAFLIWKMSEAVNDYFALITYDQLNLFFVSAPET